MRGSGSFERIEVKVIYDALARRGRPVRRASTTLRGTWATWLVLGLVNLVAAGVMCYATWWKVDRFFVYEKLILKTPLPGVDLNAAAQMFGLPPAGATDEGSTGPTPVPDGTPTFVGDTARTVIGAAAYSWLTLATMAGCSLALAAGGSLGHLGGGPARTIGRILTLVSVAALAWAAYATFQKHGLEFPSERTRMGYAALTGLCVLIGLAIGRGPGRLTRLAAFCVLLSAVGTVVSLYLGSQCGAVEPEHSSVPFMAKAFIIHSAYGWLLLPVSLRLGR